MNPIARAQAAEPWLVAGIPRVASNGGSLRAAYLWRELAARTAAATSAAFGRRGSLSLATAIAAESRLWRRSLQVASTQLVPVPALMLLHGSVHARALDLHDHPRRQSEALGVMPSPARRRALDDLVDRNAGLFETLVVPTASFATLCDLPMQKALVISNGADTTTISPAPAPGRPVVAMVSGAAPGRGIELLVDAVAAVRGEVPDATLRLALTATGPASLAYLDEIRRRLAERSWVTISSVPYASLATFLGEAAVLAVPHPKSDYMDVACPVKLFDSMAAGRPVVVTPRFETARVVTSCNAGLVARSDHADDLAGVIARLLGDARLREELGANGRRCAVEQYDWWVLGGRLADALLTQPATAQFDRAQNASR